MGAEQGDQSGSEDFVIPYGFNGNKTVILKHHFGQNLAVSADDDESIDCNVKDEALSTWSIEIDGQMDAMHVIKIKSIKSGKYLQICQGIDVKLFDADDEYSKFKVYKTENDNSYKFESVQFAQKYLCVESDDDDKSKVSVGDGNEFSEFTLWTNEEDGAYVVPAPIEEVENKEDEDNANEEEEAQKEEEEALKKAEEEEAERLRLEEEEKKRKEEEEAQKQAEEEEAARKAEEEEAERLRLAEEAAAKKKAEEEEAEKLRLEQEAKKKAEEEEAAKKKAEEQEAERLRLI